MVARNRVATQQQPDQKTISEFREEDDEGNPIRKCLQCFFPLEIDEDLLCTLCSEAARNGWS